MQCKPDMNFLAKAGFAEENRIFRSIFLIGLLAFSALGAMPVLTELTSSRHSSLSAIDALSWLWISVAFPLGGICLALHYGAPGPGRGKGWLTHIVAAVFGLSTLGWLGLRVWWYGQMLGDKGAAFESILWLKPFAWLWS